MPRRKVGILVLTGVVVAGVAAATVVEGGSKTLTADSGGGSMAAPSQAPAPYAISTLGPVGTAAQDPGGGGGGTGDPGNVGLPRIQGAQGSGSAQGPGGNDGKLYFSGSQLLDPNHSAATSGTVSIPNPLAGVAGVLGPILGPTTGGTGTTTGCATDAQSADFYAIPLQVETVGFTGTPRVHVHITGSGSVSAALEEFPAGGGACRTITSGGGSISGGVADFSLGSRGRYQFTKGSTPALVITVSGSHTITTDFNNPSFLALPGLYGV
jgi:hypothetical protein